MYKSRDKLWKDWKIIRLLAMMEFHLKSISLHLSDCWPWGQYSFPVVCFLESYSDHTLLKCESKDPADVNNYWPIAIATALANVLEQVLLSRQTRYLLTADRKFGFSNHVGQAIFALKQTVDFYRNQDTPVYMCVLDAKEAFDRVNHWILAKKLFDRNAPLHIVKLFIFWYREQEFMVQWGNSL